MAELEARNWVFGWVEHLHSWAGNMRIWEEERERNGLETCCLTLCLPWDPMDPKMKFDLSSL